MSKPLDLDNLPIVNDDEDEDLSKLDRGDGLTDADIERPDEEEEEEEEQPKRGADGKFVKKEEKPDDEEEEEEEEQPKKPAKKEEKKDEPAEEEEEEEEEETDADKAKDDKNLAIRLRKALDQRDNTRTENDALKARLAAVEARLEAVAKKSEPPAVDPAKELSTKIDDLYEKVEEARADGDSKLAAKLQRELDTANREMIRLETRKDTQQLTAEQRENIVYDTMLDAIEAADPRVVKDSDEFDQKLVTRLNRTVKGYEATGMSPTAALREACDVVLGFDPTQPKKPEAKKEEEVEKKPAAKAEAKKVDVKKNVETSKKQPPDMSTRGVNKDDVTIDVAALSDEDFEKLPEATKAKLRGDHG
jgi:hypothetical protein